MNDIIQNIKPVDIFRLLPENLKTLTSHKNIFEINPSKISKNYRKRFYKLKLNTNQYIHLTYSKNLKQTYLNSKIIYNLIPKYSCRPLFLIEKDDNSLFGQEYFDGIPINEFYYLNSNYEDEINNIFSQIKSVFDKMLKTSTKESVINEFDNFVEKLLKISYFSDFDRYFLNKLVFPKIINWINTKSPMIRWTQGDLVVNNILVNKSKDFKIIDCEFASESHFYNEDWVRLKKFTKKEFQKISFIQNLNFSLEDEIFHLLRQILINYNICKKEQSLMFCKYDTFEIFKKISILLEDNNIFLGAINLTLKNFDNKSTLLENKVQSLTKKNLKLNKSNIDLSNELILKKDKILRMQKSFSWKVTSIIRFFRRHTLDIHNCTNISSSNEVLTYDNWIKINNTFPDNNFTILDEFEYKPLISVIMPVCDPKKQFLIEAIESVLHQSYPHFQLCIADDYSKSAYVKEVLSFYTHQDSRLKVTYRKQRGNISSATNTAIKMASGDYIAFLDHDDVLHQHALFEIVKIINLKNEVKLIYTDEDKLNEKGDRTTPYFKPDWNLNLFLSQNYLCHLVVISKKTFDKHGRFRTICNGAQDWDNLLHIVNNITESEIFHIPKVLYHWRIHSESTAKSVLVKNNVLKSSLTALNDFCKRQSLDAKVEIVQNHYFNLIFNIPLKPPIVTIIIPTKDNFLLLRKCVDSITSNTAYNNLRIVIVDNNSTCQETLQLLSYYSKLHTILKYKGIFNHSAINNYAVNKISSDLYLFLNDDTEIIEPDWLTDMVSCIQQPNVAIVGCKLLYPNLRVQHAGVIIGIGEFAGHAFRHLKSNQEVMGCRLNLKQNYSAVTAACMLVKATIFREVNGFDEKNLPTSYNDVDLCLRIGAKGYKIVYIPTPVIHHESASRGLPDNKIKKQLEEDATKYMKTKWNDIYKHDPHYNPHLTRTYEDFSLNTIM